MDQAAFEQAENKAFLSFILSRFSNQTNQTSRR